MARPKFYFKQSRVYQWLELANLTTNEIRDLFGLTPKEKTLKLNQIFYFPLDYMTPRIIMKIAYILKGKDDGKGEPITISRICEEIGFFPFVKPLKNKSPNELRVMMTKAQFPKTSPYRDEYSAP